MTRTHLALGLALGLFSLSAAQAETVKIGVITPFSGPFAQYGTQYQQAIEVYQALHGTSAGGHEIEFIYKDVGGPNPDQSRSLAQELLIRERVDYLAGFTFTPNALAVAPIIEQSENADSDLQCRHLVDQPRERLLPAHQLYPVAGLGADGRLGL